MGRYYDPVKVREELQTLVKDPAEQLLLLHPAQKPFKQFPNIAVAYSSLIDWLGLYGRGRNLADEIDSYKAMKNDHEASVTKQMKRIASRFTGTALLGEIQSATAVTLRIFPYDYSMGVLNAVTAGFLRRPGTGGSPSMIYYSAHMWGPDARMLDWEKGTGFFNLYGAVWDPDAVLFHELFHAARFMKGVANRRPVSQIFANQEEFLAVVVSNIYMSEKGEWMLRRNSSPSNAILTPAEFESFLDDPRIRPSPRDMLEQMRVWQPTFWKSLAAIGPGLARFNPIRQYDDERTVTRRGTSNRTRSRSARLPTSS
jgi:hypothetical protein